MISRLLLVPLLLSTPTAAWAVHSDDQIWTTEAVTVKLDDHWRLSEELAERFSKGRHGLYEVESNTLVGYQLSTLVGIWAGYNHDPQYSEGDFTVMEQRAREQITFDNFAKLGSGQLSARMRFEQRWRAHASGTGWRVRPYLKYSMPLAGKVSLNFSDEPFINFNTTSFQARTGLERMRNLISISGPLSKHVTGEVGYMNQYGFVKNGPDTSDNVAYLALSLSI